MIGEIREGLVLGMGNPLLDICAVTDLQFLERYGLKANDAILADVKHIPMYSDMTENYNVEYVAGGACQNTMRVAQWILRTPNIASFMGCIGNDKFGKILEEKAREAGVNTCYMYQDKEPTGTCAVVITDQNRSLCAYLAAANCFKIDHIRDSNNYELIQKAQYYYLTSFFLTVSPDTMLEVVQHAQKNNKNVFLNLSAPFLVTFFSKPMLEIIPYVDILMGNETEATTFADHHKFNTSNMHEIALKLSEFENIDGCKRTVIITQGALPVVVAKDGKVSEYPVEAISSEDIVDTNGCGDAFAGGFLAMYIQQKPIETCVRCGIYAATEVIRRSGCTVPEKSSFEG